MATDNWQLSPTGQSPSDNYKNYSGHKQTPTQMEQHLVNEAVATVQALGLARQPRCDVIWWVNSRFTQVFTDLRQNRDKLLAHPRQPPNEQVDTSVRPV